MGCLFLFTVSDKTGLILSALLPNREKDALRNVLDQAFLFCTKYGFLIHSLDVDIEFKCVKDEIEPNVNLYDKNSHVHPVERAMRTVKERTRCSIQDTPFSCLLSPYRFSRSYCKLKLLTIKRFPSEDRHLQTHQPHHHSLGRP